MHRSTKNTPENVGVHRHARGTVALQTSVFVTAMHLLRWAHTATLPRTVTPYRDSVDGTRDHVTYQKLVTR
jgi:hypothetical protein